MLSLRDFLAAKSAISKTLIAKEAAMAMLARLDQLPNPSSWLKAAIDAGYFNSNKAHEIHDEVERFEFLRAEHFYANVALQHQVSQQLLDQAQATQAAVNYSKQLGAILVEQGALSPQLHQSIVARARDEFRQDAEQRLESFRQYLLAGGTVHSSKPVVAPDDRRTMRFNPPAAAKEDKGERQLMQTLNMPANLSGELLPSQFADMDLQLGGMTNADDEETVYSPTPSPKAAGGGFSFSADQLRAGQINVPGSAPKKEPVEEGETTVNIAPGSLKRAQEGAKAAANSGLLGDAMLESVIGQSYEIKKLLGQGNMGKVFLAHSKELGKDVALKVATPKGRNAEEVISRFKREILTTSFVTHENIVEVYDTEELPDGSYYMAMELLEGEELKDYLKEKGRLPAKIALEIIRQLTLALQTCHQAKIVHRDVKPENVNIVVRNGAITIKLVDFGLARLLTNVEVVKNKVFTSLATQVSGSPKYMAPESITDADKVDTRCDLYSLGVTFFELITGRVPFDDKNHKQILEHHLYSSVPLLEDVVSDVRFPRSVETTIRKLMEKERDLRFQSCAEVLKALDEIEQDLDKPVENPKRKSLLRSITDLFRSGRDTK